jgi:putative heme-binding domain-containing protein
VVERLGAADEGLRRAAIKCLTNHPEWTTAAVDLIDSLLTAQSVDDEGRHTLQALLTAFHSRPEVAESVGHAIAGKRADVSADRRALLLQQLAETAVVGESTTWTSAIGVALQADEDSVRTAAARAAIALDLKDLLPQLVSLCESPSAGSPLRLDVLRAVVRHQRRLDVASIEWLLQLIATDDRPLDQIAAAEVLAKSELTADELVRLLDVARDRVIVAPGVIRPLLEAGAAGDAAGEVLVFLSARLSSGWRPSDEELERIVSVLPAEQRAEGEHLIEIARAERSQLTSRLADYLSLSAHGDPVRGRAVFFGTNAACSTCHRIGNEGGQIGPDLTRIGASRSARDLVESIVVPSSTIAQGFDAYNVEMIDGIVLNGIVQEPSPETLVIIDSARQPTRIRREEIELMRRSSTSIMPDGFGTKLKPQEFGDLLAWLQSLR